MFNQFQIEQLVLEKNNLTFILSVSMKKKLHGMMHFKKK